MCYSAVLLYRCLPCVIVLAGGGVIVLVLTGSGVIVLAVGGVEWFWCYSVSWCWC